jgi:hypothetical protein
MARLRRRGWARRVMRVMNCERVQAGDRVPSAVDWVAKPSHVWISPSVSACLRRGEGIKHRKKDKVAKEHRGEHSPVEGSTENKRSCRLAW